MSTRHGPADTEFLAVGGRDLRVRISGPVDAPPVLLIHGIARSLEDWQRTHELLASDHRVISTDLPGFGFSRAGREKPGLPAFSRAMAGLLDAAGVSGPVHVMGNSLGGGVAMTLAVDHPERVASLVLANSIGFGSDVHLSALPMAYAALAGLPVVGSRFGAMAREAGAQVNRDLFHDPSFATPEMIRHAGRVARQPDFRATFAGTAMTLGAPVVGVRPGWRRSLLRRVRESGLPVLVVWGESDSVLPASHLAAAQEALPDARTHLFAETGHMPQVERAEAFSALAADFIADVLSDHA